MDSSPIIVNPSTPPTKFHLYSLGLAILVILGITSAVAIWRFHKSSFHPNPSSQVTNPVTIINSSVKQAFLATQHKKIIDYNDLSFNETNLDRKYRYYKILFNEIKSDYSKTKDPEALPILKLIKSFVIAFPDYHQADFNIPI